MFLFCVVFFFFFLFIYSKQQFAELLYFPLSLPFWSCWFTSQGTQERQFFIQTRKVFFFFGLKLYEIPSELICFQNPEKSLQKAHVLNPIININNKLEAVCVYLLMFNINAWEISAAQTYGFFSDECHLNESYWSCYFSFHTFRSLLLLLMAPLSISGCIKTMFWQGIWSDKEVD